MGTRFDWFKVSADLFDNPKTVRLALRLKVKKRAEAVGYVIGTWCWFVKHYARGEAPGDEITRGTLEAAAHWAGEPQQLVDALLEVGFLDRGGEPDRPVLVAHDWDEWQEAHIKKAEKDRKRMADARAKEREAKRCSETVSRASRDGPGSVAGESRGEETKRDERRGTGSPTAPTQATACAAPQATRQSWGREDVLPRLLRDLRAHFSRAISPGGQAADEAVYGACAEIRRVLIFLAPGSPREGIEYQSYRLLLSGVIRFIEKRQAATPGTVVTTLEYLAAPLAAGEVMPNTLDPRAPQHPYVEKHYPYDPRAKKTA